MWVNSRSDYPREELGSAQVAFRKNMHFAVIQIEKSLQKTGHKPSMLHLAT